MFSKIPPNPSPSFSTSAAKPELKNCTGNAHSLEGASKRAT